MIYESGMGIDIMGNGRQVTEAWSAKKEAKMKKQERRTKKERKKEYLKRKAEEVEKDDDDADDWDELAAEERMAKKVRKGKVNQKEFDTMFMDEDNEA